mmetsp:Transcript_31478/g.50986  ORF Transcript_31478/g.50986 Transcript_31478/m.50986 type:complete len:80 (-) Transcript_31478:653-892(-)
MHTDARKQYGDHWSVAYESHCQFFLRTLKYITSAMTPIKIKITKHHNTFINACRRPIVLIVRPILPNKVLPAIRFALTF